MIPKNSQERKGIIMCPIPYYTLMRKSKDKKYLRLQIVQHARSHSIKDAARVFKAERNTVRKWLRRYELYGYDGLEDLSRRPKHSPGATSSETRKELVKLKKKYKRMGAEQIKVVEDIPLSPRTMRKIWREEGISSRKRRKKHVTKQNLREIKREWALFQQVDEDTKDLMDIPEYWPQAKKNNLPKFQYTARDVTSGMTFLGFADERSLTCATLFANYLNEEFAGCGVDLSQTTRQTDNGTEYIGSWQAKEPSAYTKAIEKVPGQVHFTILPGAHRFQSDVETLHNLIEMEFFEVEKFKDERDFLSKAYSYQLFFNLMRPNTYKENKTPWQIAKEKEPELSIEVAKIKPVLLGKLMAEKLQAKRMEFLAKGGYDVPSAP